VGVIKGDKGQRISRPHNPLSGQQQNDSRSYNFYLKIDK
jgi:hypothetical protein